MTQTITMENIQTAFDIVLADIKTVLHIPENVYLSKKTIKSGRVMGKCSLIAWKIEDKVCYEEYQIRVNQCYVNAPCTKEVISDLYNVIAHEILHTIVQRHDKTFISLACFLNTTRGYNIHSRYIPNEATSSLDVLQPKYEIRCKDCGRLINVRFRKCKSVLNIDRYHSTCCSGRLKVINLEEN
jgi:predicted SprT family Zn-dependent metalloprotease